MHILRATDHAPLAWKNGLGVSRVIASHPPAVGYDAVSWQVGTTEIAADCPFSSLPGMDRRFMLLQGAGVELTCSDAAEGVNVRKSVDTAFVPFAFRGDWRTHCRLFDGAVQVLNVMTRRGHADATLDVMQIAGSASLEQRARDTLLIIVLDGALQVEGGDTAGLHDALLLDAPGGERSAIRASVATARVAIVRLVLA